MIEKYQERFLKTFKEDYQRYLFKKIDFEEKLIGIVGARGVGKTTMLFQRLLDLKKQRKKCLYLSLDYPFLSSMNLSEFAFEFAEKGGEYLLLDEVHKYNDFASHLKIIYDLSDLKVLFTGSCAMSILNAKSDLSRRVSVFELEGLSLREFLELSYKRTFRTYSLQEILEYHQDISKEVDIKPKDFEDYLHFGYYPFYFDKKNSYFESLLNIINLSIDIDLTSLNLIEQRYTYKLKKLLEVICESEPFEVNYTKISALAEISRVKLYDYLSYLNDAKLIRSVDMQCNGLAKMAKPAKIYMNNTNLMYVYKNPKIGNVRETFFVNQMITQHKIQIHYKGDFIVEDKYIFEIGGRSKDFSQIKDLPHSFIISDQTITQSKTKIPLWLFGFLY